MTTEREIDELAKRLADLTEGQEASLQVSLLAIKSERARAKEARIAGLHAMTDLEAVEEALEFTEE